MAPLAGSTSCVRGPRWMISTRMRSNAIWHTARRRAGRVSGTIRGFRHEDEPEYPYEALREAIVNAVVHRDYHRIGETVRLFMYTDRVEIRSPGGLLPGVSLDDLV